MAHMIKCDKCKRCYPLPEVNYISIYSYVDPTHGRHLKDYDICDSCYEAMVEEFEREGTEESN